MFLSKDLINSLSTQLFSKTAFLIFISIFVIGCGGGSSGDNEDEEYGPEVIRIYNQNDLSNIKKDLDGSYILMHNIALNSDGDGFDANGWIPIGNTSSEFTGTFNGNGHIISNLWINRPNDCYVGLFGWIKGGHIKNLGVKIADSGIIGKCNVGGIVGRITDLGKITTSYSKGSITGYNAGGIAGYINNGFVLYSYSEGSVIGTGSSVGGIVGRVNVGQISHSYSISNISGDQNVGGIAGYARQAVIINNAAINPSVTGYYDVNRVIGYSVKSLETSNNFALNTMTISDTVINDANGLDGASKEIGEFKLKTTYSNSIINGGLDWYFGDKNINIIGVGNKAWIMPSNSYPKLY